MAEHWILNPRLQLHWRLIDGAWLLYEDLSGGTHIMDHLSAAVLNCFESRITFAMPDLLGELAVNLALDVTAAQATSVVQQLCALGLLLPDDHPASRHVAA